MPLSPPPDRHTAPTAQKTRWLLAFSISVCLLCWFRTSATAQQTGESNLGIEWVAPYIQHYDGTAIMGVQGKRIELVVEKGVLTGYKLNGALKPLSDLNVYREALEPMLRLQFLTAAAPQPKAPEPAAAIQPLSPPLTQPEEPPVLPLVETATPTAQAATPTKATTPLMVTDEIATPLLANPSNGEPAQQSQPQPDPGPSPLEQAATDPVTSQSQAALARKNPIAQPETQHPPQSATPDMLFAKRQLIQGQMEELAKIRTERQTLETEIQRLREELERLKAERAQYPETSVPEPIQPAVEQTSEAPAPTPP